MHFTQEELADSAARQAAYEAQQAAERPDADPLEDELGKMKSAAGRAAVKKSRSKAYERHEAFIERKSFGILGSMPGVKLEDLFGRGSNAVTVNKLAKEQPQKYAVLREHAILKGLIG